MKTTIARPSRIVLKVNQVSVPEGLTGGELLPLLGSWGGSRNPIARAPSRPNFPLRALFKLPALHSGFPEVRLFLMKKCEGTVFWYILLSEESSCVVEMERGTNLLETAVACSLI